jgi:hypothetical protein
MRQTIAQREAAVGARYRTLAKFYGADLRRARSRELDVGLWWREQPDGPLHRAAWVRDTGELYLVRLGDDDGAGEVEVLAVLDSPGRLERALAGWRERCGRPRSLSWLRARVAELGRIAGRDGIVGRGSSLLVS